MRANFVVFGVALAQDALGGEQEAERDRTLARVGSLGQGPEQLVLQPEHARLATATLVVGEHQVLRWHDHVDIGAVGQRLQLGQGARGVQRAASTHDGDVLDQATAQHVDGIGGHVRGGEVFGTEGEGRATSMATLPLPITTT